MGKKEKFHILDGSPRFRFFLGKEAKSVCGAERYGRVILVWKVGGKYYHIRTNRKCDPKRICHKCLEMVD